MEEYKVKAKEKIGENLIQYFCVNFEDTCIEFHYVLEQKLFPKRIEVYVSVIKIGNEVIDCNMKTIQIVFKCLLSSYSDYNNKFIFNSTEILPKLLREKLLLLNGKKITGYFCNSIENKYGIEIPMIRTTTFEDSIFYQFH